jgi:hypothetical protein
MVTGVWAATMPEGVPPLGAHVAVPGTTVACSDRAVGTTAHWPAGRTEGPMVHSVSVKTVVVTVQPGGVAVGVLHAHGEHLRLSAAEDQPRTRGYDAGQGRAPYA